MSTQYFNIDPFHYKDIWRTDLISESSVVSQNKRYFIRFSEDSNKVPCIPCPYGMAHILTHDDTIFTMEILLAFDNQFGWIYKVVYLYKWFIYGGAYAIMLTTKLNLEWWFVRQTSLNREPRYSITKSRSLHIYVESFIGLHAFQMESCIWWGSFEINELTTTRLALQNSLAERLIEYS